MSPLGDVLTARLGALRGGQLWRSARVIVHSSATSSTSGARKYPGQSVGVSGASGCARWVRCPGAVEVRRSDPWHSWGALSGGQGDGERTGTGLARSAGHDGGQVLGGEPGHLVGAHRIEGGHPSGHQLNSRAHLVDRG